MTIINTDSISIKYNRCGFTVDILVIDDDKFAQKMVARDLDRVYTLHVANNGEEGLARAAELNPDLIILDIEMPGINGYEVCDQLRHNAKTKDIPVIFLSSLATLRDRMQGYEAGGDDYFVKPFEPETLMARINVLVRYRDSQRELQQRYKEAQKTAHIAMTGSSELGLAMQFVENSYMLHGYEELAMSFFAMSNKLGLKCTLMFLTETDEPEWFSSTGAVSPLERELLVMMREDKRFYDFGCRTIINYPSVSLLIKNMPIDDMEHYGRIKDLLPSILGALNGKLFSLNTEHGLKQQSQKLSDAFEHIRHSLLELSNSLQQNQGTGIDVMRTMLMELNQFIPYLGLEEDQEKYILDRIEQAVVESSDVFDASETISQTFHEVIHEMQALATEQHSMVENMLARQYTSYDEERKEEQYNMDVELF